MKTAIKFLFLLKLNIINLIPSFSVPKQPNVIIPADCYTDDDCPFDRTCRNERCVNPCYNPSPCGRSALCFPENHQAICKCPAGYDGSALIACIPRKYQLNSFIYCNFLEFT